MLNQSLPIIDSFVYKLLTSLIGFQSEIDIQFRYHLCMEVCNFLVSWIRSFYSLAYFYMHQFFRSFRLILFGFDPIFF